MINDLFITDDCIIEDEIYNGFKDLVKCFICKNILKDPMMCTKCQKVFCKDCIEIYTKQNKKCPNKCKKSKYKKCDDKSAMLSMLKFRCKNCKEEVKYNNVKIHLSSGCETNLTQSRLIDSLYEKRKLIKLSKDDVGKITNLGQKVNHLSRKLYILFIFIISIVITLGRGNVGKSSLINT